MCGTICVFFFAGVVDGIARAKISYAHIRVLNSVNTEENISSSVTLSFKT